MIWAVIMAGGAGTRFWPYSRERRPKQMLGIVTRRSMLRETVERLKPVVKYKNIVVVTNAQQAPQVKKELSKVQKENIIMEPMRRNTAACIGLAAIHIARRDPQGVMICLPADHIIEHKPEFHRCLKACIAMAKKGDNHLTIGISPHRAATGYGYINFGQAMDKIFGKKIYRIRQFVEKPTLAKAKKFIEAKTYLWNSGIFIWQIPVILKSIRAYMPKLFYGLYQIDQALKGTKVQKTLREVYQQLDDISIDYGIMEKVKNALAVKAKFHWSDVGSWNALEEFWKKDSNKNAIRGLAVALDSQKNIVDSPKRLTALVGVKNLIVIDSPDAMLVCSKDRAQDVKKLVDLLQQRKNLRKYLQ